jgi:hypothetical protein
MKGLLCLFMKCSWHDIGGVVESTGFLHGMGEVTYTLYQCTRCKTVKGDVRP